MADQSPETSVELPILFATITRESKTAPAETAPALSLEERLGRILLDGSYAYGLQATLGSIYRLGSLVRDRISIDTWRIINRFDQDFPPNEKRNIWLNELIPALDRLIITFAAFGGLAMESMTRGFAWRFLDMGRRVERSLATLSLLRGTLGKVIEREAPLLEAILEIADSGMTYRRRYMTTLQVAPVLDLLLADETNPRSVAFQFARLAEHVDALPRVVTSAPHGSGGQILLTAITDLRAANLQTESRPSHDNHRDSLDHLLHNFATALYAFSDTISESYLSHAIPARQLATNSPHNINDPPMYTDEHG